MTLGVGDLDMAAGDTWVNAVLGAAVAVVLGFLPFSPVLGGALAGYLQEGDTSASMRVGALSGILASIPLLMIGMLIGGALTALPFGVALFDGGAGAAVGVFSAVSIVILVFIIMGLFVYTVGLGLVGGILGGYLARETD